MNSNINNINLSRMCALFCQDMSEQGRGYLLFAGAVTALALVGMLFISFGLKPYYAALNGLTIPFLFILSAVSGSAIFRDFAHKETLTKFYMLPALQIEKFIVRISIYVLLFYVSFYVALYTADALRYVVCKSLPTVFVANEGFGHLFEGKDFGREYWAILLAAVSFQAVFIMFSTIWRSHVLFKTFLILIAFSLVWSFAVPGAADFAHNYSSIFRRWIGPVSVEWFFRVVYVAAMMINIAFCYTIAYMRIKENELINRW